MGSRPDKAYAVHQCGRFFSDPWQIHAYSIIHLCKYFQGNQDQRIIVEPKKGPQLEL